MSVSLRTTIVDGLVDQLRADIRSGRIEAGSRLRQTEVADRFNVSTTPVREAFTALEREGLLVSSPHRGVIVFKPTIQDLKEVYEIRIRLEALATELAVARMAKSDFDELARLLKAMTNAGNDADRYGELNNEFHGVIYQAAQRPRLERMIAELRATCAAYLRLWASISWTAAETNRDHKMIYEACRAKAPKRAGKAMAQHLQHTVDHVAQLLEKLELEAEQKEPVPG